MLGKFLKIFMVHEIIYQCRKCLRYFRSSDSDVHLTAQLYCPKCDRIEGSWSVNDLESGQVLQKNKDIMKCPLCWGVLKINYLASCPKCQSEDVEDRGSVSTFK